MWHQSKLNISFTQDLELNLEHSVPDMLLGLERSITKGHGIEFHGLREFQEGDSPRTIDWIASARLSDDDIKLVSREFTPEYQLHVLFVADENASMQYPPIKPRYATGLLQLFLRAALRTGAHFAVMGVGFGQPIYSDRLNSEEDLYIFLESVDVPKLRHRYSTHGRTLRELMDRVSLKNTLVVFLTDLLTLNRVPLEILAAMPQGGATKAAVIVLDEWNGFIPTSHSFEMEHPETHAVAALDMRKNRGVDREVRAFNERLAHLRQKGKAHSLSVTTVPLIAEHPLRSFYRQWQGTMAEK